MELQNQEGSQIFYQDIKKSHYDHLGSELNAMEWMLYFKKKGMSHFWNCTTWPLTKTDPYLCGFIETYYLNEQVKPIKNRVTTVTNSSKTGALEPGIAELIFDKHILGESDNNH